MKLRPIALVVTFLCLSTSPAGATVPSALEAVYSETLSAYRADDLPRTFRMLDDLLKNAPNQREFLELKALTLRKQGCPTCAPTAYEKLLKKRESGQTVDVTEMSNAQFELANLLLKQGKEDEARGLFESAAEGGPVAPSAQFFLGTMAFKAKNFQEATLRFNQAIASGDPTIGPPSYFYLARLNLQEEETLQAVQNLKIASQLARAQIDSPTSSPTTIDTATEVYGAASKLLANYDRSGYFGVVTFLTGYDTNVLAVPASQSAISVTGADSVTTVMQAGVGYSSSPTSEFQYLPSYKLSFNYNLNTATKGGDFLAHDFSVYITRNALARTNFGLHLEAVMTYQNQTDATTGDSGFNPYAYQFPIGVLFKTPLSRAWFFGGELVFAYHHDYGDDTATDDLKRSGLETTLRLNVSDTTKRPYWNPTVSFTGDVNNTSGDQSETNAFGLEFRNLFHLTDRIDSYVSGGITMTNTPNVATGSRTDELLVFGASCVDRLTPKVSALGTLQAYDNFSNFSEAFGYTRLAFSVGVSYSF